MHLNILLLTAYNWFKGFKVMFVVVKCFTIDVAGKAEISSVWLGSLHDEWREKLHVAKTKSWLKQRQSLKKKTLLGCHLRTSCKYDLVEFCTETVGAICTY